MLMYHWPAKYDQAGEVPLAKKRLRISIERKCMNRVGDIDFSVLQRVCSFYRRNELCVFMLTAGSHPRHKQMIGHGSAHSR